MAKGVIREWVDVEPGVDDNNVVLRASVMFVGATVPNGPLIDMGPEGNGVPVPWNVNATASQFSNAVETAIVARASALGFTLANTDVFFPAFSRGT